MKINTYLLLCLILLLGSGCSFLQKMDVGQKVVFMKSAARMGTFVGLERGIRDEEKRIEVATLLKEDIAKNVLALLDGENVRISSENRELLLAKIPIELRLYLEDALEILSAYSKEADIKGMLDDNAVRLLRAFFTGVIEGCDLILMEVSLNYDGMGNSSCARITECTQGR